MSLARAKTPDTVAALFPVTRKSRVIRVAAEIAVILFASVAVGAGVHHYKHIHSPQVQAVCK